MSAFKNSSLQSFYAKQGFEKLGSQTGVWEQKIETEVWEPDLCYLKFVF